MDTGSPINQFLIKKLILAGCMVSRYGVEKMQELFPEVDAFLSTDDILRLPEILTGSKITASPQGFLYDDTMPRVISSGNHTAYVKIADGCTRPCAAGCSPGAPCSSSSACT